MHTVKLSLTPTVHKIIRVKDRISVKSVNNSQTLGGFFEGFPLELNFNFLTHDITHFHKHIGEEIVW